MFGLWTEICRSTGTHENGPKAIGRRHPKLSPSTVRPDRKARGRSVDRFEEGKREELSIGWWKRRREEGIGNSEMEALRKLERVQSVLSLMEGRGFSSGHVDADRFLADFIFFLVGTSTFALLPPLVSTPNFVCVLIGWQTLRCCSKVGVFWIAWLTSRFGTSGWECMISY